MILLCLVLAASVSPWIPRVFANEAAWHTLIADRVWDYGTHRVERLVLPSNTTGPYLQNGMVYFSRPASNCQTTNVCDRVDVTLVRDGAAKEIAGVDAQIRKPTWSLSQNNQFVYFTKSTDPNTWLTAFVYDRQLKDTRELTTLARGSNELGLISIATNENRLYASVIEVDKFSKEVESSLIAKSFDNTFENRDISFLLTAPWQEVVDASNHWMLVKFQFSGGNKQLWLINEGTQEMKAIPNTWTEPQGDLVYAQFLSDGSVAFFQNYRLYTYNPKTDKEPQAHGEAKLNWFSSPSEVIQTVNDRMAWIDSVNTLYTVDAHGVTKFGTVKDKTFTLGSQFISYETDKGYRTYHFDSKQWSDHAFRVTDQVEDVLVGVDRAGNVWYQNQTTDTLVNIGYGTAPVLSDRSHAYWKGTDGTVYEARFSTLLDVVKPSVQAYKAFNASTVYLVSDKKIWQVNDEATYFSWFDSWNAVHSVTSATMHVYRDVYAFQGDAPFAPGTRMKAAGNPRVYVMGKDGQLHWIISETVAHSIYGSTWNKGILEVNEPALWRYSTGKQIDSDVTVKEI